MTYTELCANINRVCENTFPAAALALFTQQTEQKIYNIVQLPSLRKNVTSALTPSSMYTNAPADFLSAFDAAIIHPTTLAYTYLINKDVNFIREAYPTVAATGAPKYYAIFGPQTGDANELRFSFGPTPDLAYTLELNYFFYPESIVTAGDTWLGENFDSALLNGALVEAIRYMKGEPDMVALYQKMFDESVKLLKVLGEGKLRQDTYRNGQVRIKVE